MGPLIFVLLSSFISLSSSLTPDILQKRQLYNLNAKILILHDLLAKECPGYFQRNQDVTILQQSRQKTLTAQVQALEQKFLDCLKTPKNAASSTISPIASTATTLTITPAPLCPSYDGDSVFNIQLISYHNPTNKKASGVLCNPNGFPCTIYLEICVSLIGSSSCELYYQLTDVVGDQSKISIPYRLGNLTNPLGVNLGNRKWQGAHIHIIAREDIPASSLTVYNKVDEFTYDLTDVQGSHHRLLTLHGKRSSDQTELVVMFTVPCPSPSITMTTTTTLPTTTSSPVPAECVTATNLTQSWRLDHSGKDIKGGGPQAYNGYACDVRADMEWFRFTGAAGTHMLDTCPKETSCGTALPYWTDDAPPQAVGVAANIIAYRVGGDDCRHWFHPMQVMRCSLATDHDVIYRYYVTDHTSTCYEAFCGMN